MFQINCVCNIFPKFRGVGNGPDNCGLIIAYTKICQRIYKVIWEKFRIFKNMLMRQLSNCVLHS